jgi:hypothetical protein
MIEERKKETAAVKFAAQPQERGIALECLGKNDGS